MCMSFSILSVIAKIRQHLKSNRLRNGKENIDLIMEWKYTIEVLERYGNIIVNKYKDNLRKVDAVASGKLLNSARPSDVRVDDDSLTLEMIVEDYWEWIEYGRPKTKNGGTGVVLSKIKQWIRDKGIRREKRISKKTGKEYLPTEKGLAYLITRKIHNEGYNGRRPLGMSIDEIKQQMYVELEEAIQKDLNDDILVILQDIK